MLGGGKAFLATRELIHVNLGGGRLGSHARESRGGLQWDLNGTAPEFLIEWIEDDLLDDGLGRAAETLRDEVAASEAASGGICSGRGRDERC
ncbi:MAG: hypothetical protein ACREFO_20210 [Acetobacteraceae bacterium]